MVQQRDFWASCAELCGDVCAVGETLATADSNPSTIEAIHANMEVSECNVSKNTRPRLYSLEGILCNVEASVVVSRADVPEQVDNLADRDVKVKSVVPVKTFECRSCSELVFTKGGICKTCFDRRWDSISFGAASFGSSSSSVEPPRLPDVAEHHVSKGDAHAQLGFKIVSLHDRGMAGSSQKADRPHGKKK